MKSKSTKGAGATITGIFSWDKAWSYYRREKTGLPAKIKPVLAKIFLKKAKQEAWLRTQTSAKQLPPMNSRIKELEGIPSSGRSTKNLSIRIKRSASGKKGEALSMATRRGNAYFFMTGNS